MYFLIVDLKKNKIGWDNSAMGGSKLGSIILILIRCISLFEICIQNYLSFSGKKF